MISGIIYGLGAALLQSLSYLCSAIFISKYKTGAVTHLILVHIVMGVFCLALLPFLWHPAAANIQSYWLALVGAAASYMFAQFSLYRAIQASAASRVSPLLGLKIFILALISTMVFGEQYQLLQWLSVGLCILGAIWLGASGGRISLQALVWVITACFGYALSDISIVQLVQHFSMLPLVSAALLSVALCYLLCGLSCLVFVSRIKHPKLLVASTPAAASWFLAMCFLFACFAEIGVVFGGIVQSSRGLISILLTLLLAKLTISFADPVPPRRVLAHRFSAATLMTLAIAIFALNG